MATTANEDESLGASGGAAFVHACHLLAHLADGDEDVAQKLVDLKVLDLVSTRLLSATVPHITRTGPWNHDHALVDQLGTEWHPFATAATCLIASIVCEDDVGRYRIANPNLFRPAWVMRQRPQVIVDACSAALERSLLLDGGSLVAHQLHLACLRALARIAWFSPEQGRRAIAAGGLSLGVKVLNIRGNDEQAVLVALRFISQLILSSPVPQHRRLGGLADSLDSVRNRYPASEAVQREIELIAKAVGTA